MCRGGGGLGATSPHKPACKNCASLCSFLLRSLTGHFVIFHEPVYASVFPCPFPLTEHDAHLLCVQLFRSLKPKAANFTCSFPHLECLHLTLQTNSNMLAGRVVVIVAGINIWKVKTPAYSSAHACTVHLQVQTHSANKRWSLALHV